MLLAVQDLILATSFVSISIVLIGTIVVWRFGTRARRRPLHRPPITVLKPLCGDEPMLEAALATICQQAYPELQIVFGVHDAADPALRAVAAVQQRFPGCEITVVIDHRVHGVNRKISNLINMLPAARHDVLVFSDSDLHTPDDYIERIVAALEVPGVGLVTTLCTGLPTTPGQIARLGATAITHSFLPGVLMSRALGREDCLGTTMALRHETLARIGGLDTLARHLADDYVLSERVRSLGLGVGLAAVVPMTGVPERSAGALFGHELRWARTIRSMQPGLFVTASLQFPLFWAAALVALSAGTTGSVALFMVAWLVRVLAGLVVDRVLRLQPGTTGIPIMLLPLRDILSVSQVVMAYLGGDVTWRGCAMRIDQPRRARLDALRQRRNASER